MANTNTCIPKEIASKLKQQFKAKKQLTPEELRRKITSIVKQKYGAELSFENSSKIIDLSSKVKKAMKNLGGEEGIGDLTKEKEMMEYFKADIELNKYLKELDPSSDLAVATGTLGRSSMLAAPKSFIMNTVGNITNTLGEIVVRRLRSLSFNLPAQSANSKVAKDYFNMASKIFHETGVDISRMTDIGDIGAGGQRVLGKDTISSVGKGPIKWLGRKAEKYIFKGMLGYMDNWTASFNFADSALVEATKLAKGDAKLAKEIMQDAMKLKPTKVIERYKMVKGQPLIVNGKKVIEKIEIGKIVRTQAVLDANTAAFTNRSTLSAAAEGARDVLNKLTGDARAGDWFMPFVKTPANVIATGVEYAGGGYIKGLYKLASGIKNGTLKDPQVIREIADTVAKAGVGSAAAVALSSMFKPEDFVGAYDPKRQQIEQLKNSNYNAVKIGNRWVSTEYFGPLAIQLTAAMYAKQGKTTTEKINKYGKGIKSQLLETPGVDIISDAIRNETFSKDESLTDIGIDTSKKAIEQISSRLVPGIVIDISKAIDPYQRETKGTFMGGVQAKIPGLREKLPAKENVFGQKIKAESPLETILFGARVKEDRSNAIIDEVDKVSTSQGKGSSFTDWNKTTSKEISQFKDKIGEVKFNNAKMEYGNELQKELTKLFNSKTYQVLSNEDKLILINKQDDQSKEKIFRKYGFKYKQDKSKKLPNL